MFELIQVLFEKQSAIVRWNGAHTKPFFIEQGVQQGCIISPLLFCAYTEQVMREAEINSFKYIGAIKTNTGSCAEDINARIGSAKKATMELDTNWKDRGIRKELKIKLVKELIWPVITYGAEGWNLKKDDER